MDWIEWMWMWMRKVDVESGKWKVESGAVPDLTVVQNTVSSTHSHLTHYRSESKAVERGCKNLKYCHYYRPQLLWIAG